MAYTLVSNSKFQPLVGGSILAGGKLHTYLAGTTTKEDVYSDASGTAHNNPVILDSEGSATIYIDTTKAYKFKLDNSSDVEQWVVDDVTADMVCEVFKDDLLDTSDVTKNDALIKGKRTETGAVAFTLHQFDENRNLNLKTDFGALGNGTGDDGPEIQAAIDAAAEENGRTIEVPPGVYNIGSTITFKRGASFIGAQGDGGNRPMGPPVFNWTGAANGTMFETSDESLGIGQTVIDNLTFTGPSSGNQPKTLWRVIDRVDYGWVFRRCLFSHCTGDAIVLEEAATNFYMYDWRALGIGGYVINVDVNNLSFTGQLDKFTWESSSTVGGSGGLIKFDGHNAINDKNNQLGISNCTLTVRAALAEENAIIDLGCNPAISNYLQHYITVTNVFIPGANTGLTANFIKATYDLTSPPSPPEYEDQIVVSAMGLRHSSGITPIAGTATPGPPSDRQSAFFVFAPYTTGVPWPARQRIHLISDVTIDKRLLQTNIPTLTGRWPKADEGNLFYVSNAIATTIERIDNGTTGQIITLMFTDNNTKISNASFLLQGGVSAWNDIATGDSLTLIRDENDQWRELCRSVNS